MDENIIITLTTEEALVFFEWLAALNAQDSIAVETAENRVLWDMEAQLETKLPMLFGPDYAGQLEAARRRVLKLDE